MIDVPQFCEPRLVSVQCQDYKNVFGSEVACIVPRAEDGNENVRLILVDNRYFDGLKQEVVGLLVATAGSGSSRNFLIDFPSGDRVLVSPEIVTVHDNSWQNGSTTVRISPF